MSSAIYIYTTFHLQRSANDKPSSGTGEDDDDPTPPPSTSHDEPDQPDKQVCLMVRLEVLMCHFLCRKTSQRLRSI